MLQLLVLRACVPHSGFLYYHVLTDNRLCSIDLPSCMCIALSQKYNNFGDIAIIPILAKIEELKPCYLGRLEQYQFLPVFQNLEPFNLNCCVVSSIRSPFGRLHQAHLIAEGTARHHNTVNSMPYSLRIGCWFFVRVLNIGLSHDVNTQLYTAIQSHPNVFKPGVGTIKGITAKLQMKPNAQPKFCKALPVPYALQWAVEAEYHRKGGIRWVGNSHGSRAKERWHSTHSCEDYAVTVNRELNVPQCQIRLLVDVFVKLRAYQ